ncbi:hypothetical protein PF327_03695 [Sulfurovum sp. XTW-4]|uniref:Cytochrome c domain-containing protein n=1 Tax=Sulfurovum xiamenensis TaxID=3019066 RepID=A0ABT7QQC0_9BACT|nr:hypothetical protein [Sulfurovum xiamenensis]MDM5263290.1 hypothetical protein [Sulfurovum xiamenensis]
MIKMNRQSLVAVGLLGFISLTSEVKAMPLFATQTGMDCKACHIQHIERLNKFGRKFLASGMTISQKFTDANSSGSDINPSVMFKSIYEKTDNKPSESGVVKDTTVTNDGILSVPRTAALYVGGRVTNNVGALVNLSYKSQNDHSVSGKMVYAQEIQDGYMGLAAYSTADFGPFSGMEIYNSGLYKPFRTFDIRRLSNALQATEIGTGAATGLQAYFDKDGALADGDHLFATVGMYAQGQDNVQMELTSNLIPFARLAYEYPVGEYNLILGGFIMSGGETVDATSSLSIERKTYGMDFMVEGYIGDKSATLTMSKVFKNEVTYTGIGAGTSKDLDNLDNEAFSIGGEVNLTPEFGMKLSYLTFNDVYDYADGGKGRLKHINVKDLDNAITVGMDYSFKYYLPMKLTVEHSWAKPSRSDIEDYRDFLVSFNMLF